MEFKQAIVVRNDLKMGKGKIGAQCAHASLDAVDKTKAQQPDWYLAWKSSGQAKVVLKIDSENELLELFENAKKKVPAALIIDAGRTQTEPGTKTCIAIGPGPDHIIDEFTKKLKLL